MKRREVIALGGCAAVSWPFDGARSDRHRLATSFGPQGETNRMLMSAHAAPREIVPEFRDVALRRPKAE